MSSAPAELAERAVAAATGPCVVLVDVTSTANLRWAANTLTTNGLTSAYDVTVVAVHDGTRAGVVSRAGGGRTTSPGWSPTPRRPPGWPPRRRTPHPWPAARPRTPSANRPPR